MKHTEVMRVTEGEARVHAHRGMELKRILKVLK